MVTPLAGVWVEINRHQVACFVVCQVPPLAGVWVEIAMQ